jgi:CSLREA domain-containing protein
MKTRCILLLSLGWFGLSLSAGAIDVNTTADNLTAGDGHCTLREAVMNANANSDTTGGDCAAGAGADTINLPAGTYSLTLTGANEEANATGDLDFRDGAFTTVQGISAASTILDGNATDRIFQVQKGGNAVLNDLTLRNGSCPTSGGALFNMNGQLKVNRCVITGNTAAHAGGVLHQEASAPTAAFFTDCQITGNSAGRAGGAISTRTSAGVTLTNTTVSNNRTAEGGILHVDGGVYGASFLLKDTRLTGNSGGVECKTDYNLGNGFRDGGGNTVDDASCGFGYTAPSCKGSTGSAGSITWSGWLGREDLAGAPAGSAESPVEQCAAGSAVRGFKVISRLCSAANLRAALLLCDDAAGTNPATVDNGWGYRGSCSVCAEYVTQCPSGWHAVGVKVHDGAPGRGGEPEPICQHNCTGELKAPSGCSSAPINQQFSCPAGQQVVAFQQRGTGNEDRGGYEFRVGCQ